MPCRDHVREVACPTRCLCGTPGEIARLGSLQVRLCEDAVAKPSLEACAEAAAMITDRCGLLPAREVRLDDPQ